MDYDEYAVGIIPAAGKAERFGGTLKELLPVEGNKSFLRCAYDRLSLVSDIVVVITSVEKIQFHVKDLEGCSAVTFMIQNDSRDIWGAMVTGMSLEADRYFFTMPDTYMPEDSLEKMGEKDFVIGWFETEQPERFGVITPGGVVNKEPGEGTFRAWGALSWTKKVRYDWLYKAVLGDYTMAINYALGLFETDLVKLPYYYDMASSEDYKELIARTNL